ncbi:MAG: hypothetical protein AAGA44_12130 [Pseudomonadota bacterium]
MKHINDTDDVDRLFNGWRTSDSEHVEEIVSQTVTLLEGYEAFHGLRKRARRARDREVMIRVIKAILCDVMHRVKTSDGGQGRVAVSLDRTVRQDRYKAPTDTKQFPYLIHTLSSDGLRILEIDEAGDWARRRRTAVKAGRNLLMFMATSETPIRVTDFSVDRLQEIVILKKSKEILDGRTAADRSLWIDYADNPTADRYRAEMRQINYWLDGQPISYKGGRVIDITDRFLRRYFNNQSFEEGGRLFGGFWMSLRKRQRKLIRIAGDPVTTLDFDTMIARLAYAQVGLPLPPGDAYNIPGLNPEDRAGIKRVFSSMLFARSPLKAWPKFVREDFTNPPKLSDTIVAIKAHHSPLGELWFTGVGYRMMFTESQILIRALLETIANGLVALPIHDALICREDDSPLIEQIMSESFKEVAGQPATISGD